MLKLFLDSADAAQVMELMRQAELSALQITEEVPWSEDASTWAVVLLIPPARLVFRRNNGASLDDVSPSAVPEQLAEQLVSRLKREQLWRIVRRQLENRLALQG